MDEEQNNDTKPRIAWIQFDAVDVRVGKIIEVADFPEARNPSYRLEIDLGEALGVKTSVAQLPANYTKRDLVGTLAACLINLEPKQIGPILSEVLVLGFPDYAGNAVLVQPDKDVPLGGKLF